MNNRSKQKHSYTFKNSSLTLKERRAVREFSKRVRESLRSQLVEMLFFGSKARGDSGPESDIDIFILIKKNTTKLSSSISKITADIYWEFDILLSPVDYSLYERERNLRMGSPFFESVYREGIRL